MVPPTQTEPSQTSFRKLESGNLLTCRTPEHSRCKHLMHSTPDQHGPGERVPYRVFRHGEFPPRPRKLMDRDASSANPFLDQLDHARAPWCFHREPYQSMKWLWTRSPTSSVSTKRRRKIDRTAPRPASSTPNSGFLLLDRLASYRLDAPTSPSVSLWERGSSTTKRVGHHRTRARA